MCIKDVMGTFVDLNVFNSLSWILFSEKFAKRHNKPKKFYRNLDYSMVSKWLIKKSLKNVYIADQEKHKSNLVSRTCRQTNLFVGGGHVEWFQFLLVLLQTSCASHTLGFSWGIFFKWMFQVLEKVQTHLTTS